MVRMERIISDYLFENCAEIKDKYGAYSLANISAEKLDDVFGVTIDPNKYNKVINGEGNEKEKIDKAYSSSLQSLLIFSAAIKNNPIMINGVKYTAVDFEYENPVIGYPSSIDVVLTGETKDNKKAIAFIESKLVEIPRDSSKGKHKNGKYYLKNYVVGQSYFNNEANKTGAGYKNTLGLSSEDLKSFGIEEGDKKEVISKKDGKVNKRYLSLIKPLDDDKYVYSEGIKQMLAHLIGINNFKSVDGYDGEDIIQNHKAYEYVTYIELYNAFPGIQNKEIETKIDNFIVHCETVRDTLIKKDYIGEKGIINSFEIKTYQDLYKENKKFFDEYTNLVEFYHLNKSL